MTRQTNGQEPHYAVPTLSAAFAVVHRPVVAAIVNRKAMRVEAVAYEDLRADRQLFSPKHFL
jgi:hypothetical protein